MCFSFFFFFFLPPHSRDDTKGNSREAMELKCHLNPIKLLQDQKKNYHSLGFCVFFLCVTHSNKRFGCVFHQYHMFKMTQILLESYNSEYQWHILEIKYHRPCLGCFNRLYSQIFCCQQGFVGSNQNIYKWTSHTHTHTHTNTQTARHHMRCLTWSMTCNTSCVCVCVCGCAHRSSTCSIVRLQARLRVHPTHHKIVGESAGSRSCGRRSPVHPRRGVNGERERERKKDSSDYFSA